MALTGEHLSSIYERHAHAMTASIARRTFDPQVAVDIVGEAFATAFEQREGFIGDPEVMGRAWIAGIANNLLLDFYRDGGIERRAMERIGVPQHVVSEEDHRRIEDLAGSAELRAAVAEALRALPAEHRDVLELRVVREQEYSAIAERCGISQQAARARVSRALRSLREALDGNDELNEVIEHV